MRMHDIEMVILIKNRPIFEYEHNKQFFIEGRAGSNYEIELRNHSSSRVEAILSVDGLSVIDGKEAGANSRSYLIEARGTIRIPGWLLDSGSAAKFAFAAKQDSYASQTNGAQNVGVIGALIYRERPPNLNLNNWPFNYPYNWTTMNGTPNAGNPNNFNYFTSSSSSSSADAAPLGGGSSAAAANNSAAACSSMPFIGASVATPTPPSNTMQQGLGTAFGEQTNFATHTVAFERGEQLGIMTLFYDNMRGLRARGVPVERPKKIAQQQQPNAFPGLGCTPPPNWRVTGSASGS